MGKAAHKKKVKAATTKLARAYYYLTSRLLVVDSLEGRHSKAFDETMEALNQLNSRLRGGAGTKTLPSKGASQRLVVKDNGVVLPKV